MHEAALRAHFSELRRSGGLPATIDDLQMSDLAHLGWSGGPAHVQSVAEVLQRVPEEAEYLVVRTPSGQPVAKCGIDLERLEQGCAELFQLATWRPLEGLGLATALISAGQRRAAGRGVHTVRICVELDNTRARRLYEHLGYAWSHQEATGWDEIAPDGSTVRYDTVVDVLVRGIA